MPTEPENNRADELLRAYAAKRREQAGPPLELHPATRKLLLAEAARAYPNAGGAPNARRTWFGLFWPRFAAAGSLIALFFALVIWFQPPPTAPQSRQSEPALPQQPPQMSASSPDDLTRRLSENVQAAPASPTIAPTEADSISQSEPEERTAPPPARSLARSRSVIPQPREPSPGGPTVLNEQASPGTSATLSAEHQLGNRSTASAVLYFTQPSDSTRLRRNFNSPPPSTLLKSFELQQTGDQLRIVDTDGSVYTGTLLLDGQDSAPASAQTLAMPASTPTSAPAAKPGPTAAGPLQTRAELQNGNSVRTDTRIAPNRPAPGTPSQTVIEPASPLTVFRFQMSGTSRTLNQPVTLTGQLIANTGEPPTPMPASTQGVIVDAVAATAGSELSRSNVATSPVSRPGRFILHNVQLLDARASVDTNRQEIRIQAVPVR